MAVAAEDQALYAIVSGKAPETIADVIGDHAEHRCDASGC